MDLTAITLCKENDLPILVFDLMEPGQPPSRPQRGPDRYADPLMDDDARRRRARGLPGQDGQGGRPRPGRVLAPSAPGGPRRPWSRSCRVDYYGTEVPLQQLAGFQVPEARLLVITPYDKASLKAIEKAIQNSDLGHQPRATTAPSSAWPSRAHRGAAQGDGEGGAPQGRGRPGGGPQPAPGRPQGPRGAGEGRRHLLRRARPGREGAGEDHPRVRGRDRPAAAAQRSRSCSSSDREPPGSGGRGETATRDEEEASWTSATTGTNGSPSGRRRKGSGSSGRRRPRPRSTPARRPAGDPTTSPDSATSRPRRRAPAAPPLPAARTRVDPAVGRAPAAAAGAARRRSGVRRRRRRPADRARQPGRRPPAGADPASRSPGAGRPGRPRPSPPVADGAAPRPPRTPEPDLALPEEGISLGPAAGPSCPTGPIPRPARCPASARAGRRADRDDDLAAWQALGARGLRWRDGGADWDEVDDVGSLGDDEPRLGALDTSRTEHSDLYSFDEQFERLEEERSGQHPAVEPEPTAGAPTGAAAAAGPVRGRRRRGGRTARPARPRRPAVRRRRTGT